MPRRLDAVKIGQLESATLCADVMAALPAPADPDGCGFSSSKLWGGGRPDYGAPGCIANRDVCLLYDDPSIATMPLPSSR